MFENVGGGEILLILLVILVFFGPKKIPELAASLGKGIRKFNEAKEGIESQVKDAMKEPLEAMTGMKDGLETKLREAAEPLHAELKIPAGQSQPPLPAAVPAPAETMARGAFVAEASTAAEPPTSERPTPEPAAHAAQVPTHEA